MKILLRNFETGLYLKRLGKWTRNPATALFFPDQLRATAFQIRYRLANTFVVVLPEVLKKNFTPSISALS